MKGSVYLDRLSPESITRYKDWIHDCEDSHPLCNLRKQDFVPSRLIDVGDVEGQEDVKLCRTKVSPVRYIALSYVWGEKIPLRTTQSNVSNHEEGIAWTLLPKSYQDTILLARKLGVRYVWIDSLCICQDDDEERDLDISRMAEIFHEAHLVVIAAQAKSAYAGYLENDTRLFTGHPRWKFCWRDSLIRYRELELVTVKVRQTLPAHRCPREDALDDPFVRISKRAWTYQGRLLAHRCLIFQGEEVVWECRTNCYCECSGDRSVLSSKEYKPRLLPAVACESDANASLAATNDMYFAGADEAYVFWKRATKSFSGRDLSNIKDRLPAISALASVVYRATKDVYLAGIWQGDLPAQLLWYTRPTRSDHVHCKDYIAPSSSWASIAWPTQYLIYPSHIHLASCPFEIIEAQCTLSGVNPFGPVSDGYLTVKAINCGAQAAISASAATSTHGIRMVLEDRTIHGTGEVSVDLHFLDLIPVTSVRLLNERGNYISSLQRVDDPGSATQVPCAGEVRLLWIEEDACLILTRSRRVPGAFERIGILTGEMAPVAPKLPPSVITLV